MSFRQVNIWVYVVLWFNQNVNRVLSLTALKLLSPVRFLLWEGRSYMKITFICHTTRSFPLFCEFVFWTDGLSWLDSFRQLSSKYDNSCLFDVTCSPSVKSNTQNAEFLAPTLTLRSSLMACFLTFLSSLLSCLLRLCVETWGRSESLILDMRSACLAVGPRAGRTPRGTPVLLDTRIGFSWGQKEANQGGDWSYFDWIRQGCWGSLKSPWGLNKQLNRL